MTVIALSGTEANGKTSCLQKRSKCDTVLCLYEIASMFVDKGLTLEEFQKSISREEHLRLTKIEQILKKKRKPKVILVDRTAYDNVLFLERLKSHDHIPSAVKAYAYGKSLDLYDHVLLFTESLEDRGFGWGDGEFKTYFTQGVLDYYKEKVILYRNYKDDQELIDQFISQYT